MKASVEVNTREKCRLVITDQEGWASAKVGTLASNLRGRELTRISDVGSRDPAHSDFQDRERSPHDSLHGLYRALILAHCWHATWPRKCSFTRQNGPVIPLLIMDCF
jgi:hypothetical protein